MGQQGALLSELPTGADGRDRSGRQTHPRGSRNAVTVLVPVLVAMDDRYVDFIFDKFGCPVGDMLDASRPARRMDAVGAVSSIAAPIARQPPGAVGDQDRERSRMSGRAGGAGRR